MLESIDTGPLKPSQNTAAEGYCATVISNLEGWRGLSLPCTRESWHPTIGQLDTRARRLENMGAIHPPPPMDAVTWDSLMWRVARLHRKMLPGPGMIRLSVAPPITPSLALLRSTVNSIGGAGLQPWALLAEKDEELEEDDLLLIAAQFLCHLAGRRYLKIVGSFELKQNCKLALDLSLEADANSGLYAGPFPHGQRAMPRAGLFPLQKGCCGCCACSCHNITNSPNPRVVNVVKCMPRRYHKEEREGRTGFKPWIAGMFRKLRFGRRRGGRETDSDASSITSRASSTIV
ncbi:hypothetical protein GQX73_g831 [Xylaria multiplex]|uniref:Uncharacterized protein n=1 Tax=Xylaria multiplex TaxID=323545 RepID=A0A7C8N0Q3_9PEZI|nr:hypothetical protein GQX73_g831 [Xylaria multiplex]